MIYGSWHVKRNRQILFVIFGHFLLFYPTNNPKYQHFEKMKKNTWRYQHFTKSVPKIMIIFYNTVLEIWRVVDVVGIFHFRLFFPFDAPLPQQPKKSKWKKWKKKRLEISWFYRSVPKIMIICYTVPEIRYMTDLIVIFHFRLFFSLLSF